MMMMMIVGVDLDIIHKSVYLCDDIAASFTLEHPVQQSIQTPEVGDCRLVQQQGERCHLVAGGAALPHLL